MLPLRAIYGSTFGGRLHQRPAILARSFGKMASKSGDEDKRAGGSAAAKGGAPASPSGRAEDGDAPIQMAATVGTPSKASLMERLRDGMSHYWNGSKLLVYETRISTKLLLKVLRGEKLIRREYRQLVRTTGDLLRLVPLIIIMIIPFLEFALPVLLKFFPNMLPSTFEDNLQREDKAKKQLKANIETAKFLQDMAESMSASSRVGQMKELFDKARTADAILTADEIVQVCRHIGDEVTLENLDRPELANLCKYMGLHAFGTDNFLRYQVRNAIESLRKDDEMILQEGIQTLTASELKSACNARGIRTIGVSRSRMRDELQQWIEMQVKHAVPAPILILSRAFSYSRDMSLEDALRATVTSLPETVLTEAKVGGLETVGVAEGGNASVKSSTPPGATLDIGAASDGSLAASKTVGSSKEGTSSAEKLEFIRKQEELIARELEQERAEKMARPSGAEGSLGNSPASPTVGSPLSPEQIDSISEAVTTLASESPVSSERLELAELIREKVELQERSREGPPSDKAAILIEEQLARLIKETDSKLTLFESEIGKRLHLISPQSDGTISTAQLQGIMRMVRNSPKDAEKISQAIASFDTDGDGKVFIHDIVKMAEDADAFEEYGTAAMPREEPGKRGESLRGKGESLQGKGAQSPPVAPKLPATGKKPPARKGGDDGSA